MLAIRMRREGAKKRAFFRVVVTESTSPRDGSFIESLGFYNPRSKPETLEIDRERFAYWVKCGARASDTVRTVVARQPEPPAEQSSTEQPAS